MSRNIKPQSPYCHFPTRDMTPAIIVASFIPGFFTSSLLYSSFASLAGKWSWTSSKTGPKA
jgi:hypothetical protein